MYKLRPPRTVCTSAGARMARGARQRVGARQEVARRTCPRRPEFVHLVLPGNSLAHDDGGRARADASVVSDVEYRKVVTTAALGQRNGDPTITGTCNTPRNGFRFGLRQRKLGRRFAAAYESEHLRAFAGRVHPGMPCRRSGRAVLRGGDADFE